MRYWMLRVTFITGMVLAIVACADSPTQLNQQQAPDLAKPGLDDQVAPQNCVLDGLCVLEPIVVDGGCDRYQQLDWSCEDECMTSVSDQSDPESGSTVLGCPGAGDGGGGGGYPSPPGSDPVCSDPSCTKLPDSTACELDCPVEEETENSDICPQPLMGKTATALVNVAGRNHEFKFGGTMRRVNAALGRSPAWYNISGPTASNDNWWIAESGKIQLVCWGRWRFRNSLWVGTVYVQATDLHMVMSAGHPDF